MRILVSYGLVGRGGDAVHIRAVADAFRRLGHETLMIGPRPLQPYQFAGVEGRLRTLLGRWPWWAKDAIAIVLSLSFLVRARRRLRGQAFDLVVHNGGIYEFIGQRLARATHARLVMYLHAPAAMEREIRREKYFPSLHAHCMNEVARSAHLIATISQSALDLYAQTGMPADRMLVCPDGVPEDLLRRGAALARAHPPLCDERICTVGFVGSLNPLHRVEILLDALRRLGPEGGWRLIIVGGGEEYAGLRQHIGDQHFGTRVEWRGGVPRERAFEEIAGFDIAVLPYTPTAATPMKLFEYAAVGRPIIAPDLPNIRALFGDGEMYFFAPGDPGPLATALRALRRAPDTARDLGRRAQERARDYITERILARLIEKAAALPPRSPGRAAG
jgi:glycosyltransferase involved in cell wall biosynthesis